MTVLLLLGGARSGKSALAVRLAQARGGPVCVVATAEPGDEEMARRIREHRASRPADWRAIEEPRDVESAMKEVPAETTVILDCLTLWVANLMQDRPSEEVEQRASALGTWCGARTGLTIVVSNEVGLGLVSPNPLGRAYRDLLGRVNVAWARAAEEVLFLVAGRAVRLEPVDVDRWRLGRG